MLLLVFAARRARSSFLQRPPSPLASFEVAAAGGAFLRLDGFSKPRPAGSPALIIHTFAVIIAQVLEPLRLPARGAAAGARLLLEGGRRRRADAQIHVEPGGGRGGCEPEPRGGAAEVGRRRDGAVGPRGSNLLITLDSTKIAQRGGPHHRGARTPGAITHKCAE